MTFWGPDFDELERVDPEIAGVVVDELSRLRSGLQLIASENFTSPAVLAALGSTLSNKYAEGYPGKRYYGGCEVVDVAEQIGIDRAKELFGADHANLQPHSGASANQAVYGAFMNPGDTFLGMSLDHGGHLTHGYKVSFSGKWFNAVHYGVSQETEHIDYDQVRDLAERHGFALDRKAHKADPGAYHGTMREASNIVRVTLTGSGQSPSLDQIAGVLGADEVRRRVGDGRGGLGQKNFRWRCGGRPVMPGVCWPLLATGFQLQYPDYRAGYQALLTNLARE